MIKFDSYNVLHKNPTGAVKSGCDIKFAVHANKSLKTEYINLVIRDEKSVSFKLEKTSSDGEYDIFEGVAALDAPGLYCYRFELVDGNGRMVFAGTQDGHTADTGDWLPEWKLCVYDSDFYTSDVPDGAIMYQIFPDRFFCADGVDTSGAKNERVIHKDWSERPYCHYDYPEYRCNDYFMGNLRGIEQKLPYLKELGITYLYLNPIFESAENHRYCTSDYMKIDPYLGTTEDFISLCKSAHEYDIRVILDGVFSHTGDDSIYFNRYHHYGDGGAYNDENSPYYDWYNFKGDHNKYDCWWGFKTLPNVNETNAKYLEFITGKNGVLQYWLSLGADGYRLDVADELPDLFLEKLRAAVKGYSKDALIIGEVWENAVTKVSYGQRRKFLLGQQCDSVMNYPFLNAIVDFMIDADSEKFYSSVMDIVDLYPEPSLKCLMNMLSTHDTARIINRLGAVTIPDRRLHADARLSEEQYKKGKDRFKTAAALQYTLPGIPCIYYGDEAGLQGFSDPSCRGTYPWGNEDKELITLHKELGDIRKKYASEFSEPIVFEKHKDGVISYTRGCIRVTANNSGKSIAVSGKKIWAHRFDTLLETGGVIIEEITE